MRCIVPAREYCDGDAVTAGNGIGLFLRVWNMRGIVFLSEKGCIL
jgi:hypothetical protein